MLRSPNWLVGGPGFECGMLAPEPWFVTTDHTARGQRVYDRVLTGGEG